VAHNQLKIEINVPNNIGGQSAFASLLTEIRTMIRELGIEQGKIGNPHGDDSTEIRAEWKITHVPDPEPTDPDR
jgi:hypothetical protein